MTITLGLYFFFITYLTNNLFINFFGVFLFRVEMFHLTNKQQRTLNLLRLSASKRLLRTKLRDKSKTWLKTGSLIYWKFSNKKCPSSFCKQLQNISHFVIITKPHNFSLNKTQLKKQAKESFPRNTLHIYPLQARTLIWNIYSRDIPTTITTKKSHTQ